MNIEERYISLFNKSSSVSPGDEVFAELSTTDQNIASHYYQAGESDGVFGNLRTTVSHLTKQHAVSFQKLVLGRLSGNVSGKDEKMERFRNENALLDEEIRRLERYRLLTQANSKYLPKFFMGGSIWLYVIVGLLLVAADISLSWVLAVDMFDLKQNEVFKAGVISVGITMLTIFVKLYYDQYIGIPDGVSRIRYKEIRKLTGDQRDWRLTGEMFLKILFNSLILTAVILIFYFLANTRLAVTSEMALIRNNPDAKWLFVLINLFMPVVGGICFSIAQKIHLNRKALLGLGSTIAEKKAEQEAIGSAINQLTIQQGELNLILEEWVKTNLFVDYYQGQYEHSYNQGFQQGYSSPDGQDNSLSLMKRVELYRSRHFARKMRTLNAPQS